MAKPTETFNRWSGVARPMGLIPKKDRDLLERPLDEFERMQQWLSDRIYPIEEEKYPLPERFYDEENKWWMEKNWPPHEGRSPEEIRNPPTGENEPTFVQWDDRRSEMASMDEMKAELARLLAEKAAAGDADAAAQLKALQASGAMSGGGFSPRDRMMHYQGQINEDPDYEEGKNPGSRSPRYSDAPKPVKRMQREEDTETGRLAKRGGEFPDTKKPRTTKADPTPRGRVGKRTSDELDLINRMMLEGVIPGR